MLPPTIAVNNISLELENKPLFTDLTLSFEGGKISCLLGPSGCGKSTLLKLIADSATLPFTGTITRLPCSDQPRQVAWMGQNDLLLPWLNLLDNVLLGARLRGEIDAGRRHKATLLLDEAGLKGYEQALPATLSGGMRQRGALLRTLMEDCPVLLMDEPFSALDSLTRVRLQDLALRLIRGKTVVLVTHDPLEALRLSDRILVLAGTPARVAQIIVPEGVAPRDPGNPHLARQYAMLMQLLLQGSSL